MIVDNKLLSIYAFEPLTILQPDLRNPLCHSTLICKKRGKWDLSRCRGGTPGISWNKTKLLFLVHEVDRDFNYLHRFVVLDHFEIIAVTIPFYFESLGIEYAAGLTHMLDGQHVMISYGSQDAVAKCQKIRTTDLESFINATTTHRV